MKKALSAILILLMCAICCSGCNIDNNNVMNDNIDNQEVEEQKSVDLTIDNINQYLIFSTDLGETEKFDNPYAGKYLYTVKMTVKTSSKQNVEFENLTVNFDVVPESSTAGYGWDKVFEPKTETEFKGTLNIPYNGIWEEVFEIKSEYKEFVSSNPSLKIVITSVSGVAKYK